MTPSAAQLAARDPAMAAAMGLLPGSSEGSNFGNDGGMGFDMGADFGAEGFGGDEELFEEFADFGGDMGADFGAAHRRHGHHGHAAKGPHVSPQTLAKLIAFFKSHRRRHHNQMGRLRLLDPNMGVSTKIERYTFSINQLDSIVIGSITPIYLSGQPATSIRPQRLVVNVPCPSFVYYTDIKVANVAVSIGATGDAWEFNANAVGSHLDMPTLTPANTFTFIGNSTEVNPAPYAAPYEYPLVATVQGPATIAG